MLGYDCVDCGTERDAEPDTGFTNAVVRAGLRTGSDSFGDAVRLRLSRSIPGGISITGRVYVAVSVTRCDVVTGAFGVALIQHSEKVQLVIEERDAAHDRPVDDHVHVFFCAA